MHPEIRSFPSREFYAEALEDGAGMADSTARPWHSHPLLGPFSFVNVGGKEYNPAGTGSWANDDEAEMVIELAKTLARGSPAAGRGPWLFPRARRQEACVYPRVLPARWAWRRT